ncbi:DUF4126 domain-containing protein [Terriglobus roseus]|uniref:DUF4126 domain-containing protein n=1 Tax=Terriglobus roseus TaxID=392734 RepID=A0A1G7R317_9BACT|nr:DUF4126 domain-containing protein [Terriglobus roseus]SDG05153.1 protein of unknown function [Terriglobus roseus]
MTLACSPAEKYTEPAASEAIVSFTPGNLAALIIAASFSAGLNTYATLLTLGLAAHTRWVQLPPGLEVVGNWWVIGVCSVLFLAEFIADKVPTLDVAWNALHTVVRIPVAALLAYRATEHLTPPMQIAAIAAGAAIAALAHTSKTALRVAVTPSPEPFSNIALSSTEDVAAVGLTWLATSHPWLSASIVLVLLGIALFAIRWVIRLFRRAFRSGVAALPQPPMP